MYVTVVSKRIEDYKGHILNIHTLMIRYTDNTGAADSVSIYSLSRDNILLHMPSLPVIHFKITQFADMLQIRTYCTT